MRRAAFSLLTFGVIRTCIQFLHCVQKIRFQLARMVFYTFPCTVLIDKVGAASA
jgi:hypothetical protein